MLKDHREWLNQAEYDLDTAQFMFSEADIFILCLCVIWLWKKH